MKAQDYFYSAEDVAGALGYSKDHAYKIIRSLNQELKQQGYLVRRGFVPKQYFTDRYRIPAGGEGTVNGT